MRVTNNMMVNNMMLHLNRNLERMDKTQQQMSTGKKILVPSDDPIIAARALKLRTNVSEIEQFSRNVEDGLNWLDTTEGVMSNIGNILGRTRDLAVQAANGTLSEEDRSNIRKEIEQSKNSLISQMNASYAGRYIFSGFQTDKPLLDSNGDYNLAVQRSEKINYEVSVSDRVDINTVGQDLLLSSAQVTGNSITVPFPIAGPLAGTINITSDADNIAATSYDLSTISVPINDLQDLETKMQNLLQDDADVRLVGDALQITTKSSAPSSKIVISATATTFALGLTNGVDDVNQYGEPLIQKKGTIDLDFTVPIALTGIITIGGQTFDLTTAGPPATAVDENDLITKLKNINAVPAVPPIQLEDKLNITMGGKRLNFTSKDPNVSAIEFSGISATLGIPDEKMQGTKTPLLIQKLDLLISHLDGKSIPNGSTQEQEVSKDLKEMDVVFNKVLEMRADLGARYNRLEMTKNRLEDDNVNFTKLMSNNEDADMAEILMNLQTQENVYKASMAAGARIIQPTLIDFLR